MQVASDHRFLSPTDRKQLGDWPGGCGSGRRCPAQRRTPRRERARPDRPHGRHAVLADNSPLRDGPSESGLGAVLRLILDWIVIRSEARDPGISIDRAEGIGTHLTSVIVSNRSRRIPTAILLPQASTGFVPSCVLRPPLPFAA